MKLGTPAIIVGAALFFVAHSLAAPQENAFRHPSGVALDRYGRIYIADTENNRIVRIDDMSGKGWTTFGTQGTGRGKFNLPGGIAIDKVDCIYVVDTWNNRIVRFSDMKGTGWIAFGKVGNSRNEFDGPEGVALDASGRIHVADSRNRRIVRVDDMTGTGWISLGGEAFRGPFFKPVHITVDREGRIYFTDTFEDFGGGRVVRVDSMTAEIRWSIANTPIRGFTAFGDPRFNGSIRLGSPRGIAVAADGGIYLTNWDYLLRAADMAGKQVKVLEGRGGAECWSTKRQLPPCPPECPVRSAAKVCPDRFSKPLGIAIDPTRRVLIVDALNNRIVRVNDMRGTGWVTLGGRPK